MAIKGTPKFTELRLAQFSVDMTKSSMDINATAALVDPRSPGAAAAWHKASGSVWSSTTMEALKELISSMEADMARIIMDDIDAPDATRSARTQPKKTSGLGEHLTGEDDPPQM